jgi:N-dimethylarginine dimethylaminohydrolase
MLVITQRYAVLFRILLITRVSLQALMVAPTHFTVEYTINPWMGGTVDAAKAMQQWTQLKQALEANGVQVRVFVFS